MFMEKGKLIFFACVEEILIVILIAAACNFNNYVYYLFYNLCYGILVSVLVPTIILIQEGKGFQDVGIVKLGKRQFIVLFAFVFFSVGGQIIPKIALGERLDYEVLSIAVFPLIMTTFFEEFFFRGFIQTHVEKQFGGAAAVITSGLLFSLYHLGYPGFRTLGDILLLLAVGIGFAIAFKLSHNNLIVSYFVNLPNAFVTYILKHDQFPVMTFESNVYAVLTIVILVIGFYAFRSKRKKLQ